jgi:hypothetical protein
MWTAKIQTYAMTREAAIDTLKTAFEDAIKTNFEDANKGPVIWGHMSRQSGIVIEEVDMATARTLGWPEGRMMQEMRLAQLKMETAELERELEAGKDRSVTNPPDNTNANL